MTHMHTDWLIGFNVKLELHNTNAHLTGLHGTYKVPAEDKSSAYLRRNFWTGKLESLLLTVPWTASPLRQGGGSLTAPTTRRAMVTDLT